MTSVVPNKIRVSSSLSKMNLPNIMHPMSRLDRNNLKVHGETPRLALSKANTFVALREDGKLHLGLGKSGLPRLSWNESCGDLTVRNLTDKGKYNRPIVSASRIGVEELENDIQEKLTTGFHGFKYLFRSNDPGGRGSVTREGLLKILYNLVGHVPSDQYSKLLKHMGLEHRTQITFDDFVAHFKDNEVVQREWLSTAKKVGLQKKSLEDSMIPSTDGHHQMTASTCHVILKDRAKSQGMKILAVLPPTCIEPDNLILKPHLATILKNLNINIHEEEFSKLWKRYDKKGVGAVKRKHFLTSIGLDNNGHPQENTPRETVKQSVPMKLPSLANFHSMLKPKKDEKEQEGGEKETSRQNTENAVDSTRTKNKRNSTVDVSNRKVDKVQRRRNVENSDDVIDLLHYKFEEGYYSLLMGMQCYDFMGDGQISRIDFKKVLDEHDIIIKAMDLEYFLNKIGVKCLRSMVPYKDFLVKFWNKGENGLVHRIVTNNRHVFTMDVPMMTPTGSLNQEQVEARLVDFLHKDFLQMLHALKKCDKYKLGVVTKHEFKDILARFVGKPLTETQWKNLLNAVTLDADGLVPYQKFMDIFTTSKPGIWNKKDVCSIPVIKMRRSPTFTVEKLRTDADMEMKSLRPELDKLHEDSSEYISMELKRKVARNIEELKKAKQGRPLHMLNNLVYELFRYRFQDIDKAFKSHDRRMTGRFSKQQFTDMMNQCNLNMVPNEADELWGTYDVSADGLVTFGSLVQHYEEWGLHKNDPTFKQDYSDSEKREIQFPEYHGLYTYAYHNVNPDWPLAQEPRTGMPTSRENAKTSLKTTSGRKLTEILLKIKPMVEKQWENLKSIFGHTDRLGQNCILGIDMQDVIRTLRFPITPEDMQKLLAAFDRNRDGHFHYKDFLKHFVNETTSKSEGAEEGPLNHIRSAFGDKHCSIETMGFKEEVTLTDILQKIRNKLLKEQKLLRRAFKKADMRGNGILNIQEFKTVLKSCGITINAEDLYHIMSEFDTNMDGKISYEQFMAAAMTTG